MKLDIKGGPLRMVEAGGERLLPFTTIDHALLAVRAAMPVGGAVAPQEVVDALRQYFQFLSTSPVVPPPTGTESSAKVGD